VQLKAKPSAAPSAGDVAMGRGTLMDIRTAVDGDTENPPKRSKRSCAIAS
jgi:hypothetical protein